MDIKRIAEVVDEQPSWLIALEVVVLVTLLVLMFTGVLPNDLPLA